MNEVVGIKYTGAALPGSSATVVLFDSTQMTNAESASSYNSFAHWLAMTGLRWLKYSIWNSHSGTVNFYESDDGGTNWRRFQSDTIAASPTDAATESRLVEGKRDIKVEFVNDGTAQTVFDVHLSLSQRT